MPDASSTESTAYAAPVALEITDLRHTYGPVRALDGIDLQARHGEVTALLGPNGAGKTTAISCAIGLLRPDSGSVRVLGHEPWHADADLRSQIGVMIQDGGLASGARAMQLLRYGASLHAHPLPVTDLAEQLGITSFSSTLVRRLSGGQRQRLALALALVGRPRLLFLDEPTAGMDPAIRRTVRDLIRSLAADGCAVVLTTHLMDDVEELADQVVVIADGRVLARGTPHGIVEAHHRTDGTVDLSAHAVALSPERAAQLGSALRETAARHGVDLQISQTAGSLESVLLDLTGAPAHATQRAEKETNR